MPPKKSGRKYTKKTAQGTKRYKKPTHFAASTLQAAVRSVLAKQIETKRSTTTNTDGQEIYHNSFLTLSGNMLITSQGVQDPTNTNLNNRIGDQINLKGVSIKMMIELNERYSDVTFRLIIVKCAKGDIPNRTTLFTGLSGNKMLDTFNSERFTILFSKYFKIKAPNTGTFGGSAGAGSGVNAAYGATDLVMSRATKIIKVNIAGTKFAKSGVIQYENDSTQPKFFDYHTLLYAYSNYSTLQDLFYVARVNDYIQTIYYKDA